MSRINESHLDRIERGESQPTMPIVFRICEALDIDPLTLADEMALEFRQEVKNRFPTRPLPAEVS